MMAKRTFFSGALLISVTLLVIFVQGSYCCGSSNRYSNTYYTKISEVSPDEVAERLTPKLQEMADALVHTTAEQSRKELQQIASWLNASKGEIEEILNAQSLQEGQETSLNNLKSSIEGLEQQMQNNRAGVILYLRENHIISEYIQNLCRLIYDDVRGQAMTLKEIMIKIIETYDMTEKNSEKLDETKQAVAENKGEVLKVEDETFAIYQLLVKIVNRMDKEANMWTTGQVELIAFSLAGVILLLVLTIVGLICRHHTKTELRLKWLWFCASAQGRYKYELRPNNNPNRELSCIKKDLEYVNPLTNDADNYF